MLEIEQGARLIAEHLDEAFAKSTLVRLVQTPSDVPADEIAIEPDDPKIGHYVREVVQPIVAGLQPDELAVDELNNLVARWGGHSGPAALLLVGYSVSQHANLMDDPYSGRVAPAKELGWDEPCVYGKGASQNKGGLAALLAALQAVRAAGLTARKPLIVAVNSEGQSSHRCMRRIIDGHRVSAGAGVLCIGTGNRISLGNRGRVDVYVTVRGKSAHSSQPWLGINAIDGLGEVLAKLQRLRPSIQHAHLGRSQLTVYNVACHPSAPHTIPDTCRAIVDRRILPGEEPEKVVNEIRSAIGSLSTGTVEVAEGAMMYPALVAPEHSIVTRLQAWHTAWDGQKAETFYPQYTFDAGYPCHAGIPTVMYGPASWADVTLGEEIVQTEFVALSQVMTAAKVYAGLILQQFS